MESAHYWISLFVGKVMGCLGETFLEAHSHQSLFKPSSSRQRRAVFSNLLHKAKGVSDPNNLELQLIHATFLQNGCSQQEINYA